MTLVGPPGAGAAGLLPPLSLRESKAVATPAAAAGVVSAAGARAATTDAGIWDAIEACGAAVVTGAATPEDKAVRALRMDSATLLHRVWDVDALKCPRCEGPMKFIATITDRAVIVRILTHLGLPAAKVVAAPARRAAGLYTRGPERAHPRGVGRALRGCLTGRAIGCPTPNTSAPDSYTPPP